MNQGNSEKLCQETNYVIKGNTPSYPFLDLLLFGRSNAVLASSFNGVLFQRYRNSRLIFPLVSDVILSTRIVNSFLYFEITSEEIKSTINATRTYKIPGFDGTTPRIGNLNPGVSFPFLENIFYNALQDSVYPTRPGLEK